MSLFIVHMLINLFFPLELSPTPNYFGIKALVLLLLLEVDHFAQGYLLTQQKFSHEILGRVILTGIRTSHMCLELNLKLHWHSYFYDACWTSNWVPMMVRFFLIPFSIDRWLAVWFILLSIIQISLMSSVCLDSLYYTLCSYLMDSSIFEWCSTIALFFPTISSLERCAYTGAV